MKKALKALLFICLIIYGTTAYAELSDQTYTDDVSGVTFKIPVGWTESNSSYENILMRLKWDSDATVSIVYTNEDVWSGLGNYDEISNYSRIECDNSFVGEEGFLEMFNSLGKSLETAPEDIKVQEYNGYQYYTAQFDYIYNYEGMDIPMHIMQCYSIINGYMNCFQFTGQTDIAAYSDFIEMLGSADLGPISTVSYNNYEDNSYTDYEQKQYSLPTIDDILISFLITILVYSIPMIIYRFAIRKEPMEKKPAIILTVVYAVIAYMIMFSLLVVLLNGKMSGSAIWIWSFINYRVLIFDGAAKTKQPFESYTFSITCSKCGHSFKIKYNKPNSKEKVPALKANCPKCNSEEIFRYENS